jgi:hypothetical protein
MIGDRAASELRGQRVLPPQPGKSGEIAVSRAQDQPVLDRQRRKMRVMHETDPDARQTK